MKLSILASTTILTNIFSAIQRHLLSYSDRASNSTELDHHEHFVVAAQLPLHLQNSGSDFFCSGLYKPQSSIVTRISDPISVVFYTCVKSSDLAWYFFNVL